MVNSQCHKTTTITVAGKSFFLLLRQKPQKPAKISSGGMKAARGEESNIID
jgi:hypothetical protein